MQQHAGLLQEQDDALDTLEGGIKRIKALGKVMETELKEQAVILESLDEDIDKADSNMQSLQKLSLHRAVTTSLALSFGC